VSHFSVLVITTEEPTEELLTETLMPWHEYECTGFENQYVVDVDRTQEALAEFAKATVDVLRDDCGKYYSFFTPVGEWHPLFSQPDPETDSWDRNRRTYFVPENYTRVEIPASEFGPAHEWITDYYGWKVKDPTAPNYAPEDFLYGYQELNPETGDTLRCIDRTNPNKKWDWWVIGGRWSGHIPVFGMAKPVNQAQLKNVNFELLESEATQRATNFWIDVHEAVDALPPIVSFQTIREQNPDIDVARDTYWAQPGIEALKKAFPNSFGFDKHLDAIAKTKDEYIQSEVQACFMTFAVVKDGVWHERGKMGWFAFVSDEKDKVVWAEEFNTMLKSLPGETWLTVVDCHI